LIESAREIKVLLFSLLKISALPTISSKETGTFSVEHSSANLRVERRRIPTKILKKIEDYLFQTSQRT
jgi:hypothetical protein